jgi:hypothetical protein
VPDVAARAAEDEARAAAAVAQVRSLQSALRAQERQMNAVERQAERSQEKADQLREAADEAQFRARELDDEAAELRHDGSPDAPARADKVAAKAHEWRARAEASRCWTEWKLMSSRKAAEASSARTAFPEGSRFRPSQTMPAAASTSRRSIDSGRVQVGAEGFLSCGRWTLGTFR